MTIEIYNDSSAYVGKVDNGYIYQSSSSILGDDQVGFVEDWRVYSTEESRDQVAVVENNGYIDRVGSGTTSERIGWVNSNNEVADTNHDSYGYLEGGGSEEEIGAAAAALLLGMV